MIGTITNSSKTATQRESLNSGGMVGPFPFDTRRRSSASSRMMSVSRATVTSRWPSETVPEFYTRSDAACVRNAEGIIKCRNDPGLLDFDAWPISPVQGGTIGRPLAITQVVDFDRGSGHCWRIDNPGEGS